MDAEFISYLRTYEYDVFVHCLSTDYVEMEKGEGNKVRVFDKQLWDELDAKITTQIKSDYYKFTNGAFEDELLTQIHINTCGGHSPY